MADIPLACSLNAEQVPVRRAALIDLVEHGLLDATVIRGVGRLTFRADERTAASLDAFVRAERECCPFLDLCVTRTAEAVLLEVRGPDGAEEVIAGLVDAFRSPREAPLPPGA
jgi:hypothetical protein